MSPTSTRSGRARRGVALALALGLGVLSGCSDDGGDEGTTTPTASAEAPETTTSSAAPTSSAPAAEGESVAVSAVDFSFEFSEDSFAAGTYSFEVTNDGAMPHNLRVERDGQDIGGTDVIEPGQSATVEITLEAGDYVFYCGVGQHRANGMELPVTVSA